MLDPLVRAVKRQDGRNIDPEVGTLSGEASAQRATRASAHPAPPSAAAVEEGDGPTYHGLPVLKEPVWKWMIPAYFFTGGLAGACAVLGAAAQLTREPSARELSRRCRLVAAGGAGVSAALLVADLGRPSRFLNMMRVFRPTSPMNMGTWVLAGFSALSGVAALPAVAPALPRRRWAWPRPATPERRVVRALRRPGLARTADAAWAGAGVLGLPLVGYTGVLLANTAVPLWQQTRNALPVLFAFSGAVSAGAVFDLWPLPEPAATMARRFSLLAKGAELTTSFGLDGEARRVPRVARPLTRGRSGALLQAARLLLLGSAAADVLGRRRPAARRAAGALALLGTIALRFGIVAAGRASARDPYATFAMQRAGAGAAEISAREGRTDMPTVPGVEPTGHSSAPVQEPHGAHA